jgi:hypothetical protein
MSKCGIIISMGDPHRKIAMRSPFLRRFQMPLKQFIRFMAAAFLVVALSLPAQAQDYHYRHITFSQTLLKDLEKLLPRGMAYFIYQNQDEFMRGITLMTRQILTNPGKNKDIEEIRREAYARLMRDIPYCVEAFKGGEIKLDSSPGNVANRLGMIAFSIIMRKIPDFPDLEYTAKFIRTFEEAVSETLFDVWVYYDGYGDFNSLGELMERLRNSDTMPQFRLARNPFYPVYMKQDPFAMFRPPPKHDRRIVITDIDVNNIYSEIINCVMDTFVYIWKCSGMELAHPSYTAPPGTIVTRPNTRRVVRGVKVTRTVRGFSPTGAPSIRASYGTARSTEDKAPDGPEMTTTSAAPNEFAEGESTITSVVETQPTRVQSGGYDTKNKPRAAAISGLRRQKAASTAE